jgi:ankyrin repeat protein
MNFFRQSTKSGSGSGPQSGSESESGIDMLLKDSRISYPKLYAAIVKGDDVILFSKLIKEHKKHNKFEINKKDANGWSLLYYAVVWKREQCTQFLLENGANVNIINDYGHTPLYYAKHAGYTNMVVILINWNNLIHNE